MRKWTPWVRKREPKGTKREPNQKGAKGNQKGAKGNQKESQRATNMHPQTDLGETSREGREKGGIGHKFLDRVGIWFHVKSIKKLCKN